MNSKQIKNIFKREFVSFFNSPIAYIIISIFIVVTGWFFFSTFFLSGRADMRDFFTLLPIIFAFTIPAITMRIFADEYKSGSYEILLTLPLSKLDIILGKYLSSLALVVTMLIPTFIFVPFVFLSGDLDLGPVWGGYIGAFFLAASFTAIGVLASSLTRNQIVAFIISISICFFLVLIDKFLIFLPGFLGKFLQYLGADYHFKNVAKGIIDSRDLLYFLSVTYLSLHLTYVVTQEKK